MKILAFDVGMSVRSTWTIMYGASDSRPVADLSRASVIVACVWPFCVSITASDFVRNLATRPPLGPPPLSPPSPPLPGISACRNTVTSTRCLPKPCSLNCMSRRRCTWSLPSRTTRPLLPRMTVPARRALSRPPKQSRVSTIMTGIDGAYSLELIARHRDVVIGEDSGRSYPNILM